MDDQNYGIRILGSINIDIFKENKLFNFAASIVWFKPAHLHLAGSIFCLNVFFRSVCSADGQEVERTKLLKQGSYHRNG